eukprot:GHVQ01034847.1.p1 GENE.GHVQ01034847.1~~GHVQ01034847.1.p1  ORF type:complete len:120 (+),score=9.83 GHVQ01034847.1:380-739(+)
MRPMENTRPRRGSYTTSLSCTGRDTTSAVTSFLPKAVGTPLSNMSNTSRLLSTRRLAPTPAGLPAAASGSLAEMASGIFIVCTPISIAAFLGGVLFVLWVRETMCRKKTLKRVNYRRGW